MHATDPGADNEASYGAGRRGRHRVLATGTILHFTAETAQARQVHSAPATRSASMRLPRRCGCHRQGRCEIFLTLCHGKSLYFCFRNQTKTKLDQHQAAAAQSEGMAPRALELDVAPYQVFALRACSSTPGHLSCYAATRALRLPLTPCGLRCTLEAMLGQWHEGGDNMPFGRVALQPC